jgi:hypothetical protein
MFQLTMLVQRVSNFRGGNARTLAMDRTTALKIDRKPSVHRMPILSSNSVITKAHVMPPRAAAVTVSDIAAEEDKRDLHANMRPCANPLLSGKYSGRMGVRT